jgi:ABC-type thiamin/hydroxymethylpyrimidine transport system permease subunit
MKKLTKREKVIIVVSAVVLGVVYIKFGRRYNMAARHYNKLADKLCSGGIWIATDITPKGFNLVRAVIEKKG